MLVMRSLKAFYRSEIMISSDDLQVDRKGEGAY